MVADPTSLPQVEDDRLRIGELPALGQPPANIARRWGEIPRLGFEQRVIDGYDSRLHSCLLQIDVEDSRTASGQEVP